MAMYSPVRVEKNWYLRFSILESICFPILNKGDLMIFIMK